MMNPGEGCRGDLEFGTIPRLLELAALRYEVNMAIEDGDVRLTFPALEQDVRRIARALIGLGVQHGDRIAIWAPNLWEWVAVALGIHCVGGVLVPINTRFKGSEASDVLLRTQARMLFTIRALPSSDYIQLLLDAQVDLPDLQHIVVIRGDAPKGTFSWRSFLAAGNGVAARHVIARSERVRPDDVADILFTSGTTGKARGVPSTHAQNLRAFRDWAEIVGLRKGDRYLIVVPFFHSFGYKAGWLACLMMGATLLPQHAFDVDALLKRVDRERVTVLPGPPSLYQSMLGRMDLERFDLSSLRLAVTGAASIPVELIHRMRRELNFEVIITAYGLTEATGLSTLCRREDPPETIARTSGRPIPGVEVAVVDEQGTELEPEVPGEVVVRGYSVTRGHLDDAGPTAARIDSQGWLHTGDIGVMDRDGNLRITDRKQDMFIVGGFHAYPAEIEGVLLTHPGILQVAIVGREDDRLGEVGVAFVVPRPGHLLDERLLITWCRERLASYKVPRSACFLEALPTNATGKVMKFELRERARTLRAAGT